MSGALTPSQTSFRWLGTAGFELRLGPASVLIDPFLSRPPQARPKLDLRPRDLAADAVFLTHGHLDHAYDVPAIARQTGAPVYASAPVCAMLHDLGVPARGLHPLVGGRACRVGAVEVLVVPARHARFDLPLVWRGLRRIGRRVFRLLRAFGAYPCGDVLGYQFSNEGKAVVHFGSAGWYREQLERLRPDVALIPLQGRSDIYRVAGRAVEWLQPRQVIPHHHDDFYPPVSERIDVRPFVELIGERMPSVEVVEPRIGEWMPC